MSLNDWGIALPTVSGLDPESVACFLEADLDQIILPTKGVRAELSGITLDSDAYIERIVSQRSKLLSAFLGSVAAALNISRTDRDVLRFEALAGDSHNGGRRPLLVHFASGSQVLKFADPRPYLLLAEVLEEV